MSMIILNKFVDVMEVIRIKMVAFYAEVSLNRFSKELRFVDVSLGDFVCVVQSSRSNRVCLSESCGRSNFRDVNCAQRY